MSRSQSRHFRIQVWRGHGWDYSGDEQYETVIDAYRAAINEFEPCCDWRVVDDKGITRNANIQWIRAEELLQQIRAQRAVVAPRLYNALCRLVDNADLCFDDCDCERCEAIREGRAALKQAGAESRYW